MTLYLTVTVIQSQKQLYLDKNVLNQLQHDSLGGKLQLGRIFLFISDQCHGTGITNMLHYILNLNELKWALI